VSVELTPSECRLLEHAKGLLTLFVKETRRGWAHHCGHSERVWQRASWWL